MNLQQKLNVVIGVITNNDQQVLLAQRTAKQHLAGLWEFPGGKIEGGETAQQALQRELMEELKIHIIQANHWFKHEYSYPEHDITFDIWRVTSFEGEPYGHENQLIAWYSIQHLPELNIPPANQRIIELLTNCK